MQAHTFLIQDCCWRSDGICSLHSLSQLPQHHRLLVMGSHLPACELPAAQSRPSRRSSGHCRRHCHCCEKTSPPHAYSTDPKQQGRQSWIQNGSNCLLASCCCFALLMMMACRATVCLIALGFLQAVGAFVLQSASLLESIHAPRSSATSVLYRSAQRHYMCVADDIDFTGEATRERIEKLVTTHQIMLFMKGNRLMPSCGYSGTMIQILNQLGVPYETRDVLTDERLRVGIKEYSNWPTIPVSTMMTSYCDHVLCATASEHCKSFAIFRACLMVYLSYILC
jgi:glutaredoxin-related protein